ncbi:MAG: response regulator [Acidobacteria bacterium]|nr:response regulator [Acidobacteriota bacterium]
MEFIPDIHIQEILKNVFTFFGTLSEEGYVLSFDGKIFDKIDTDPQLLIGHKFSETVYWQSSEYISQRVDKAIEEAVEGKNTKILVDFRVSANEIINIELYLQPLTSDIEKSEPIIFFCAKDVTKREQEIEHYKERSEHLLYAAENAEIGLWYWNLVEDEIYSTPKCNELFEVPAHDIITLDSITEIIHPDDRSRVRTALEESQTQGREYNAEFRVIYSDGNIQWLGARGKTYLDKDGTPKNMMGVIRIITDKKLANEELSKVYDHEKKARDGAEEANRAKDFFLAVVSHELRSPLNAILGWTKILLTKEVDETTRKNALETIEKSARSQAKLIDDLVDSARVSSGKLRLEFRSLNFYEVIKTVYNSFKPSAEAKNIDLEFSADKQDIQVFGDMFRLEQIFTNLLSNALKFTSSGGTIKINVQTEKDAVKVTVHDDGKGINPDSLPNIFKQFRQGDENMSIEQSGLGLGLSIVKILTEKHNGTILAESEGIGQGSTFTVTLPLCGSQTAFLGEEVKEIKSDTNKLLSGIKVLVIEDDPDSREVLQLYLKQSGANVESVESAQKALMLLRESSDSLPDVIVSDLAMPEEDGYSLIERIRNLPVENGSKIPALALSAFASNDNKQKAFDAGFQKYHTKPFEPDEIIKDIQELVKK